MTMATSLRHALAVLVIALFATACSATPTITVTPVAGELSATSDLDNRIDLQLRRNDVDCSERALTLVGGTTVRTAHQVVKGRLGAVCFGESNPVLVDAWKLLVDVTPPEQLKQVAVFAGFSHINNRGLRQVSVATPIGWAGMHLSVDLEHVGDGGQKVLRTMVREVAHVLTLNLQEYDSTVSGSRCTTFYDGYGCYHRHSLMNQWVDAFWTDEMIQTIDWSRQLTPAAGQALCLSNEGFWDSFSAADPFEDFAESYARYTLRQKPETAGQQARSDWFASRSDLGKSREYAERAGHGPYVGGGPRCG